MNPYNADCIWTIKNGHKVALLTPDELQNVEDGTELVSISGKRVVVGKDYIDNDTRAGYLAYGFEFHE
jgi:hypothetical protein